ncbi:MAG: tetratricopeptide repeat protein [Opitutales bacterium]
MPPGATTSMFRLFDRTTGSEPETSPRRDYPGFGLGAAWLLGLLLLTGAGRVLGAEEAAVAETRATLMLPPFVVDEDLGLKWRYARIPGLEILSSCSDTTTQQLVEQNDRLSQLLGLFLPPSLQPSFGVPVTYVLYPQRKMGSLAKKLSDALMTRAADSADDIRFMPNFRCTGPDALVVCFIVNDLNYDRHRVDLTPGFLQYLLTVRTPELPPWFVAGLLTLYQQVSLSTDFTVGKGMQTTQERGGFGSPAVEDNTLAFHPLVWLSPPDANQIAALKLPRTKAARAAALAKWLQAHQQWVPLTDLFAPRPPTGAESTAVERLRRAEASLFIRWTFDDPGSGRLQALWKFVSATCSTPATEAVFQSCFGLDYAQAETQLLAYLPEAVSGSFNLPTDGLRGAPQAEFRDATVGEVSRLKGRLEQLEIPYVTESLPQVVEAYRVQARATMRKAYDVGDRNPELLAEIGLGECGAGDDVAARPFLEAAVASHTARPSAYYELARILLARSTPVALSAPAAQGREITRLLEAGRQLAPPLPGFYLLMVRIWIAEKHTPTPAQLAAIDEGTRLFPHEVNLLYAAAIINALNQREDRARALVSQALQVAGDAGEVSRLRKFQALLTPRKG